jgi:F-type H+-transporting ATPase subunit h
MLKVFYNVADMVQDLYLRELKAYKPTPAKANDHEGHVKSWSAPAAPKVPDLGDASAESDLSSYKSAVVETESSAPDASAVSKPVEDWFDEKEAFAEDPEEHH